MLEDAGNLTTTVVAQQSGVDTVGVGAAVAVAVIAAALFVWHVQQVKKRPATTYDKLVGGVWAAVIVFAIGRALSLVL